MSIQNRGKKSSNNSDSKIGRKRRICGTANNYSVFDAGCSDFIPDGIIRIYCLHVRLYAFAISNRARPCVTENLSSHLVLKSRHMHTWSSGLLGMRGGKDNNGHKLSSNYSNDLRPYNRVAHMSGEWHGAAVITPSVVRRMRKGGWLGERPMGGR